MIMTDIKLSILRGLYCIPQILEVPRRGMGASGSLPPPLEVEWTLDDESFTVVPCWVTSVCIKSWTSSIWPAMYISFALTCRTCPCWQLSWKSTQRMRELQKRMVGQVPLVLRHHHRRRHSQSHIVLLLSFLLLQFLLLFWCVCG